MHIKTRVGRKDPMLIIERVDANNRRIAKFQQIKDIVGFGGGQKKVK